MGWYCPYEGLNDAVRNNIGLANISRTSSTGTQPVIRTRFYPKLAINVCIISRYWLGRALIKCTFTLSCCFLMLTMDLISVSMPLCGPKPPIYKTKMIFFKGSLPASGSEIKRLPRFSILWTLYESS